MMSNFYRALFLAVLALSVFACEDGSSSGGHGGSGTTAGSGGAGGQGAAEGTAGGAGAPEIPEPSGECVCRCGGDDPFGHGCAPAWYLTGEAVTPAACSSCGDQGEQVWICYDSQAPPDCARLGDAPYASAGFYCCGCTQ